ncbi:hypothetical protein CDAR_523551 [Caerostris darwini]|uniref:Uncharacterized protein n=1 Tax=Caerostris darwini TaxID=1538125 RepID=A0AAV4VS29_9ARAC|nr:hypothetical protein CDAR_523551 [Caerostris darwini]
MSCFVGTQSDYRFPKPCYLFSRASALCAEETFNRGIRKHSEADCTAHHYICSECCLFLSRALFMDNKVIPKGAKWRLLRQHSFSQRAVAIRFRRINKCVNYLFFAQGFFRNVPFWPTDWIIYSVYIAL